MSTNRSIRGLAALALCVGCAFAAAPQASAAARNRPLANTPSTNMPIGSLPAACQSAPTGATCTNAVIVALDQARTALGLGPYVLPAGFDSLSPARQLFILANLDRIAYGLPPIAGLSPALGSATQGGMLNDADPDPTSVLASLPSYAWTSNWAGGWANAAYAYYEWMYDDGYGGAETSNVDCTGLAAHGCWDHRRNVLGFANPGTLALGAAVGSDSNGQSSYAITLVWTPAGAWTSYSYTWSQAQAAGAGAPHGSKLRLAHH